MADRRLRVFHAVARHLSFTRAAEAVAELDARLKEIGGQDSGPPQIGASTTLAEFLLPQVLGEYKARHPAVVPRLFVANSEAVQSRVAERSLDLGFFEGDSHLPTFVNDMCCEDELRVVRAPWHALAKAMSVAPGELIEHACRSQGGPPRRAGRDRALAPAGAPARGGLSQGAVPLSAWSRASCASRSNGLPRCPRPGARRPAAEEASEELADTVEERPEHGTSVAESGT